MTQLVLSLFPGIGLLDKAFELEGFCVVRGPDLLWGGDIREFHPPAGVFNGVIGGPPCQSHSTLRHLEKASGSPTTAREHNRPVVVGNIIPEFERCVAEAMPDWFVMENVKQAPLPVVQGYQVHDVLYNNRWAGAEQDRVRRFSFGTTWGARLQPDVCAMENPARSPTVTTYEFGGKKNPHYGRSLAEMVRLQGLPEDFDLPGMTVEAKRRAVANGVPLPMGRAIANAVSRSVSLLGDE